MSVYIYIYMCVYIYICVYIERGRGGTPSLMSATTTGWSGPEDGGAGGGGVS